MCFFSFLFSCDLRVEAVEDTRRLCVHQEGVSSLVCCGKRHTVACSPHFAPVSVLQTHRAQRAPGLIGSAGKTWRVLTTHIRGALHLRQTHLVDTQPPYGDWNHTLKSDFITRILRLLVQFFCHLTTVLLPLWRKEFNFKGLLYVPCWELLRIHWSFGVCSWNLSDRSECKSRVLTSVSHRPSDTWWRLGLTGTLMWMKIGMREYEMMKWNKSWIYLDFCFPFIILYILSRFSCFSPYDWLTPASSE